MENNNACRQIMFASTEFLEKSFKQEDEKHYTAMQSAMSLMRVSLSMIGSKKLPWTTRGGGLSCRTSTSNQVSVLNASSHGRYHELVRVRLAGNSREYVELDRNPFRRQRLEQFRAPASPGEARDGPKIERKGWNYAQDHVREDSEVPSFRFHASKSAGQGRNRKVLVQSKARGERKTNLIKQASKMTSEPAKLSANSEDKRAGTFKHSMSCFKEIEPVSVL
jgi:hypothetical protein